MIELKPIASISVPRPRPDETYTLSFLGQGYSFTGLKRLLAAADVGKAGDRHAGLAAASEVHREAARSILASLTLDHLYHHPLTDDRGEVDEVMRVNYDVDLEAFGALASRTLGELKDHLLSAPGPEVARAGKALTGVMAAALAKICDVHELVYLASKIHRTARARATLGLPGTLGSRLQPNHPTDDPRGIALLLAWGLSIGAGDALLGVNPAVDTVENVSAVLRLLDETRRRHDVPTQICVLAHIKTQLSCLAQGAPVEILFQSLAGTEATNVTEFDITVELLDHGYRTMAERGPLRGTAPQFTYFETGQGSEYTYGKHHGIDMTTTEALCYGLARRYDPFMVNNVTGFIGPETHLDGFEMILSNLQDHFMGKLLGLPMGMAPCYTLHARTGLEAQQMAIQMLAAAGANYYMDVALGTDRMLAYFDTSGYDVQTAREVHGRRPAPEYLEWAVGRGIFAIGPGGAVVRGPRWGDVRAFLEDGADLDRLAAAAPPPRGLGTAGPRADSATSRNMRLHQAAAREAVHAELRVQELSASLGLRPITTRAATRDEHLDSPVRGAELSPESEVALSPEDAEVQILVSDGLSAEAVHHNLPDLLPVLLDGLGAREDRQAVPRVGRPLIARHARVKLAEPVAERLGARLVIHLIGERPGGDALASRSLSAYLVYRTGDPRGAAGAGAKGEAARFETTVISNIYEQGLPPAEAGALIVEKVLLILAHEAAGNRLEALLAGGA
jgi:ethanolamine ammonia-lyase large subunit